MRNSASVCSCCGFAHPYIGFIYRWTNTDNGKWYIGSHAGCAEDGYIGSGIAFRRALRAHGLDKFERDILFFCITSQRDLLDFEEEILIQIDARNDRQSYNLKNKGIGQDPEFARAFFTGRAQTEEQKTKRKQTVETLGLFKGNLNGRSQAVVCLNTGQVFDYARLAASAIGGTEPGISEACKKGYLHRGSEWMFAAEWEAAGNPDHHPQYEARARSKWRIVRLSDGEIFDSAAHAGRTLNCTAMTISVAVDCPTKSAGGHYWMSEARWREEGEPLRIFKPFDRSRGKVVDVTTGTIYPSAGACARANAITSEGVMATLKGKTKTGRFMFVEDWEVAGRPVHPIEKKRQKRSVKNVETGQTFHSLTEAAKFAGGTPSGLQLAIENVRPYKGMRYEYTDCGHGQAQPLPSISAEHG